MLKTYYKWRRCASINYLNDKDYIDNELHTVDSYTASLQTDLRNKNKDNNYNSKFKYLHSIRGGNSKQLLEHIETILSNESEIKYHQSIMNILKIHTVCILTTDSRDIYQK